MEQCKILQSILTSRSVHSQNVIYRVLTCVFIVQVGLRVLFFVVYPVVSIPASFACPISASDIAVRSFFSWCKSSLTVSSEFDSIPYFIDTVIFLDENVAMHPIFVSLLGHRLTRSYTDLVASLYKGWLLSYYLTLDRFLGTVTHQWTREESKRHICRKLEASITC